MPAANSMQQDRAYIAVLLDEWMAQMTGNEQWTMESELQATASNPAKNRAGKVITSCWQFSLSSTIFDGDRFKAACTGAAQDINMVVMLVDLGNHMRV